MTDAFTDDLITDLADPEFARTFVAQMRDEIHRTASALEATCQKEERERKALEEIESKPHVYGGASAVARWGLGDDTATWSR